MSINDLLEQGITIQGPYEIREWDNELDCNHTLVKGDDFASEHYAIGEEILDKEISFIYPITYDMGILVIEVKEKE